MESKKKILVVEDEPDILKTVQIMLEMEGYEVISASDGITALNQARQQSPDLIILDIMLPKLDGYKVCRLLKYDKKHSTIPIIVFTARSRKEDEDLAKDSGADLFITKPFNPDKLINAINQFLS
jgi:DNA-binding response OmpR family regulator